MTETNPTSNSENLDTNSDKIVNKKSGPISTWLHQNGFKNIPLDPDHLGIEIIKVEPNDLLVTVEALKSNGFNYLQCQGGYDEGPGENIVCFYNFIELSDEIPNSQPREVRVKVFLKRDGELTIPSIYSIFRGADWQERETFDMYGVNFKDHPHPKRLLMPEDWKGWPLRKDYVQPDFYEMQDAY